MPSNNEVIPTSSQSVLVQRSRVERVSVQGGGCAGGDVCGTSSRESEREKRERKRERERERERGTRGEEETVPVHTARVNSCVEEECHTTSINPGRESTQIFKAKSQTTLINTRIRDWHQISTHCQDPVDPVPESQATSIRQSQYINRQTTPVNNKHSGAFTPLP